MERNLTAGAAYEMAALRAERRAMTRLLAGEILTHDGKPFGGDRKLSTEQRAILLG